MEKYRKDRLDLVTLQKFSDKKVVVEVEVTNVVDRQLLADNIVCELEKKYNIKKKECEN